MPISIRTLAPTIATASYRFAADHEVVEEDFPWIHARTDDGRLCGNCSRLNFPWLFKHPLSAHKVSDGARTAQLSDGICLGLYADISSRSTCNFCQLLVHALEEGADIELMNQYDAWPQQEVWINNHFLSETGFVMIPESETDEVIARLGVRLKADDEEDVIISFKGRTTMIQEIVEPSRNPANGAGRAVDTNVEDLVETIGGWLKPCLTQQAPPAAMSKRGESAIRLIDTEKYCIVGPFCKQRYVALSYTWGRIDPLVLLEHNDDELRIEGALIRHKSRLPITIQDAIRLCALLGERYLWVDSLCIMQDTPDKHSQIQRMDQIYQEATFCIVAAAGMDANAGLPGVSKSRDARQHIVEVDGMRLANTIPPLIQSLSQTYWESRGWCFQESLLSSRKVIFTASQTYYHCQHGECGEDTYSSIHVNFGMATGGIPWRLNLEGQSNWSTYSHVVAEYSTRYLSFESDVLNAFAGISNFLSTSIFFGSPFVMGIPICSLEVGLMWHPSTRLQRRSATDIPSWSWAGWIGHVEYPGTAEHEKVFDRTISKVKWHMDTENAFLTCVPAQSWHGWKDWRRVVVGELDDVRYIHVKSGPARWFAHPIAQQPWPVRPYSPFLECTAEVASLKLTGEHTDFWAENEVCEDGHQVCHLKVFDQHDNLAGVVVMDGATFEHTSFSKKSFAFVKISQTTLTALDDPAWDPETKTFAGQPGKPGINPEPAPPLAEEEFDQDVYDCNVCWCMYNVLVIDVDGEVARRLAVGRIYYSVFDNASPESRTIRLG